MQGVMWPVAAAAEAAELPEWEALDSVLVRAPAITICAPSERSQLPSAAARADVSNACSAPHVQLHATHGTLTIRQVLAAVQHLLSGSSGYDGADGSSRPRRATVFNEDVASEGAVLDGLRRVSPAGCMPIVYTIRTVQAA